MQYTDYQMQMIKFLEYNRQLHMPTTSGTGMSVLPVSYAVRTKWIGRIIYITPKALHSQIAHEIHKWTGILSKIVVGMQQPIPLFFAVVIMTPQTLKFRVRELCHIKPRFVITYCLKTGWDDVRTLCTGAERVCLLGGESTMNTRRIVG